jgi:GNAT superfamily N-acetyltransferase
MINLLFTESIFRDKGIGSQLIDFAIAEAKKRAVSELLY